MSQRRTEAEARTSQEEGRSQAALVWGVRAIARRRRMGEGARKGRRR